METAVLITQVKGPGCVLTRQHDFLSDAPSPQQIFPLELLTDRSLLLDAAEEADIRSADHIRLVLNTADSWVTRLCSGTEAGAALGALVERADLKPDGLRLVLRLEISDKHSKILNREISRSSFDPGVKLGQPIAGEVTSGRFRPHPCGCGGERLRELTDFLF